jgi:hypothetical protein
MKKTLLLTLFSMVLLFPAVAVDKVIDGFFQGENLFVYNPLDESGADFCITKVTVNDKDANCVVNSNAFEINLKQFGFTKGQQIVVTIHHKDGCEPKILNQETLNPQSTFTITSINVNSSGLLQWTTIEEQGKIPYLVEQFRWGKWVVLGTVEGIGSTRQNEYVYELASNSKVKPHSEVNLYRVRQVDYRGKSRLSLQTKYKSSVPVATMTFDSKAKTVTFSSKTSYEVINELGETEFEGYAESVDVSKLKKGEYFVNFDNATTTIKVKK